MTTLILNIFPDRQYKKYIKLFAGLLLLALIFNPIVQFKKIKINLNEIISGYTRGNYEISLDEDVLELETKMYERMSNEYQETSEYVEN
jgi:stage III sporulation protein AF